MGLGIQNATNVTMGNIMDMVNSSSYPEFMIKVNHIVYDGWMFFILLWVLWIILFVAAQHKENQVLTNAMYSGAVVTLISLFLRAMTIYYKGITIGLLSDYQMWAFAILTIVLGTALWFTKRM